MKKFIFQLGRDKELGILEILSVIPKNLILEIYEQNGFLFIKCDDTKNPKQYFTNLAGIIKIGEVVCEFDKFSEQIFDQIDFYYPKNFTLFYSVSDNDLANQFENFGHSFIKKNKLKGQISAVKDDYFKADSYIQKDNEKNIELMLVNHNRNISIAKTVFYSNSDEFKKLDELRPDRKFTHGTSFRLVRTMMNILSPSPGETIVDPFCGTGTFLIEAIRRNINAVGIDNAQHLIQIAKKNIDFFTKEFKSTSKVKLICGSSESAEFEANHVIFEPYMGPFLSQLPTSKRAKETINELHGLYVRVLKNMHSHTTASSRIVCILPYIKSIDNQIFEIPKDIFNQCGYILDNLQERLGYDIENPIEYNAADGSKIGRRLYVLNKV